MKFEEEIVNLNTRIARIEAFLSLDISELHYVPEPRPDLLPVTTLPEPIAVVTRNPEYSPLEKSSGEDQNPGDWTQSGDGNSYPVIGSVTLGEPNEIVRLTHDAMVDATTTEDKPAE